MFCITMMIRNYYEVHGTFNGIENTILHNRIEEMRAKTEMSYSDFLYAQLGYKKIEHGPLAKLSFEELSEVRALYITRQNKELAKMLDVKETGNINSMFKDAGIPILSYRLEDWKIDPKYEEIVKLLSFYYKNDTNLFCVINNRPLPMFYSLEVLTTKSVNIQKMLDVLMADKEINRALAKIKYKKGSKLFIQGKYCITPVNYSDEDKLLIQRKALEIACFPYSANLNKLFKTSQNLLFLSIQDNSKYLKVLDFAKAIGTTYQEIASTYGIHLPDQMPVFNKYGVLLFKLTKDQSYVIDASCDEIKCPYKEKSLMFN